MKIANLLHEAASVIEAAGYRPDLVEELRTYAKDLDPGPMTAKILSETLMAMRKAFLVDARTLCDRINLPQGVYKDLAAWTRTSKVGVLQCDIHGLDNERGYRKGETVLYGALEPSLQGGQQLFWNPPSLPNPGLQAVRKLTDHRSIKEL